LRLRTLIVGLAAATSLIIAAAPAAAQSVQLVPFGGQTFNQPFYVTGAPGDPSRVFVDEAGGTIRLVKDGVTQPTPFLDISSDVYRGSGCFYSDCGLFSMALAPDYATSGLFYVFYTRAPTMTDEFGLRIEEFRRSAANPDVADPASGRIVLEIPRVNLPGGGNPTAGHNGGQLQFGPDGLLYISVGDGDCCADPAGNGQNTAVLDGKLLRINPTGTMPGEYSIPADNPFAGATPGRDEIYAYGLRNPYRFSFDRLTGDLALGDVGEGAWEEVDFMPRGTGSGANFGWDCFEGNHVFFLAPSSCTSSPPANPTPPVLEYAHSTNPRGPASVMGGYVIRDGALPSLLGRYIYADTYNTLGGQLHTAQLSAGSSSGDSALGVSATNVVSFGEDACAHIYVASIGGTVSRLEPTSGPFPCSPPPPPAITSVSPADGATQVSRSALAIVYFNKAMDKAATQGAFSLKRTSDGAPVSGQFGWYGPGVLLFKPDADLAPGTQYTASVSTAAKDTAGNPLATAKTWQFTTANPPSINFVRPAEDATEAQQNATVVVAFDRSMDKAATQGAFSLKRTSDGAPVSGTFGWYGPAVLIFKPNSDLAAGTQYTATVSTAAKDTAGNTLQAAKSWQFTTATPPAVQSVSPPDGATGVSPSSVTYAIFNRAMDKAATEAAFSLKRTSDGAPVSGTFGWYGPAVLIFKPNSDLAAGTQYTATISTAAKDPQGNTLAAPVTWSYTTAASG
jgi:glucose/arabinose dehydrogenase